MPIYRNLFRILENKYHLKYRGKPDCNLQYPKVNTKKSMVFHEKMALPIFSELKVEEETAQICRPWMVSA